MKRLLGWVMTSYLSLRTESSGWGTPTEVQGFSFSSQWLLWRVSVLFCTSVQVLTHIRASEEQRLQHNWHIQVEICRIAEMTPCFTKWCITFTVITIKLYCPNSSHTHSCCSLRWTLLYTGTDWIQADQSAVIMWRPCHHLSQSCVKFPSGAEQMLDWNSSEIHWDMKQWKVSWDQTRETKL